MNALEVAIMAAVEELTEPQARASACQNGFKAWRMTPIATLRAELCSVLYDKETAEVAE